ncbi:bifunctional metallophosphatase/5'-nucleotidase [Bacillus taeanensis]|uniref:Bifunctional metallophosphatase/5'-nucleotidase n=1 Tax=Bacillus taeanensis TaxID=273032 RepID=A0A366Y0X5_9BACI|nr:bifunctional metallophosphatase/5'-nucleotidase [Bacillus taeanensis]RBW69831.1 bifunctional metallophosphatase/5'-nucleotidase [Bacillus taeanensis]
MRFSEQLLITVLVTSDIHGNIYPINYGDNSEVQHGLAKLSSLIKKERKINEHILLLDNGDLIQGTPLTYYYVKYQREKGNPMINVLNVLNYDAAVIGNHEFNYGIDTLNQAVKESSFPWLSANIIDKHKKKPIFGNPYIIKEIQGIKAAVLGVTTHYIPNWENPHHIEGLIFKDAFQTVKEWVYYIRKHEKPDVLIVSYHGGFERELATGKAIESLTTENQAYDMCKDIDGIDILVTGHQHRSIASELNGVTIIQPSFNGQALGKVTLILEKEQDHWIIKNKSAELIEVTEEVETDREISELACECEEQTQTWLDQPIGIVSGDMTVKDILDIRLKDNPLIEFINAVQMDAAGVSISNTALFHNQSPGFKNHITMRDIVSNYVYPNTLKVIRISGQDIKDALEKSATYFIINEKKEIAVNPEFVEPKPQHYNYDMWEGIEYELKISNPIGERVVKLHVNGRPIDLTAEFDVVMNNYRAGGGGDYEMYKDKKVIKEITIDMSELIANYILERKVIHANCNENWKVVI